MASATSAANNRQAAAAASFNSNAAASNNSKQIDSNLSNFLNVRFEVCMPQQQQVVSTASVSQVTAALQQQMSTSSNEIINPAPQCDDGWRSVCIAAPAVKSATPPGVVVAPTPAAAAASSKKYKKSIKIVSVSCKRLNASGDPSQSGDITLKNYEFTEKCLSFRLASIDLNQSLAGKNNSDNISINSTNGKRFIYIKSTIY
jgi:hypothetical protein